MRRAIVLVLGLAVLSVTAWAQDFIHYIPPSLAITGGTLTGPLVLPDGAVGAPSLAFAGSEGIYHTTNVIRFTVGGANQFNIGAGYIVAGTTDNVTVGLASNLFKDLYLSRSIQGSKAFTLTDAAGAVSFVRIAVPTNANMGGHLIYTATSTDGANGSLTSTAEYNFSGADLGGTVTCGISAQLGIATAYSRANTLVCAVTTVTSTTNCDLQATCTDNKAGAQTVTLNWRLDMPIANTVTPQ